MVSYKNLCIHETSTTGTGTLTLGSSPNLGISGQPARSLEAGDDGNTLNYYLENGTDGWESGTGVYTHSGTTFTRVLGNSSTGSLLDLSATTKVYIGDVAAADLDELFAFKTSATASIATNTSDISTNAADIATNAGNIAANASAIADLETFEAAATASIATNAADIVALETFQADTESIFAAAIADGTFTTAAGDEIVTANGLITSATQGPVTLPGTVGTNTYFLQSNGDGTTTWADVVHQNWSENGGGHLIPDTNNIRDIGTTSMRPRDLYLAGDADISGNLTVGGTATITGRSSFASAATFDAGYREPYTDQSGSTQLTFPVASSIILREGADPTTDIEFGAGFCYILDNLGGGDFAYRRIGITGGWEKQMDSTWAAGDNAGGMQSGDALSADTLYYVRLIENTTTGRTEIIAYDNTATDPSGYSSGFVAIPIGRFHTDPSGDIEWRVSEACKVGDIYYPAAEDLSDGDALLFDATNSRIYGGTAASTDYGNFIEGLQINSDTDTDHDLEIATGRCASSDGAAIITCGSATVIAIDNASHRVDSSTLDADTDYYILAGMDAGVFVAGFSKVDSLPSGWDSYRAIGRYHTDGSSNLRDTVMGEDRKVIYQPRERSLIAYTSSTLPTTATKHDAGVPGDAIVDGSIVYNESSGSRTIRYLPGICTDTTDAKELFHPGDNNFRSTRIELQCDSSGQIYIWGVTNAPDSCYLHVDGYWWNA